ncbi:hypothetical protein TthHB5018_c25850 (plasmid) [Thermus thermophilus]|uniref:Uncharacterized protein n=1 Tax=Thermus thermophilus TaxID=274 RepID=A0A7R7TGD9_THETH|nr:hypothetical protein TthHB5018_c25850 [Thermus thermophilus]
MRVVHRTHFVTRYTPRRTREGWEKSSRVRLLGSHESTWLTLFRLLVIPPQSRLESQSNWARAGTDMNPLD